MLYYHFELTFSETIFLLFTSLYFLMTYFGVGGEVWAKYSSYVLLLLIIIAVLLNTWLDHALIPLETLRPGEREALHMTAILYMQIIFAYIKFGYKNDNYDSIIQYFILLMIGRFVCFDTTINAMQKTFHSLVSSLPLLAMALASTGVMAYVEYSIHYLVTPNGVVFNFFIAQLYLLVIMSIVYKIRSSFWKKDDELNGTSGAGHASIRDFYAGKFSGGSSDAGRTAGDRKSGGSYYGGTATGSRYDVPLVNVNGCRTIPGLLIRWRKWGRDPAISSASPVLLLLNLRLFSPDPGWLSRMTRTAPGRSGILLGSRRFRCQSVRRSLRSPG